MPLRTNSGIDMGEIIYGTDFRKHLSKPKPEGLETLEQMACRLMDVVWRDTELEDTTPCEYVPPESDPA